jgi:hypothetical protein
MSDIFIARQVNVNSDGTLSMLVGKEWLTFSLLGIDLPDEDSPRRRIALMVLRNLLIGNEFFIKPRRLSNGITGIFIYLADESISINRKLISLGLARKVDLIYDEL